MIEIRRYTKQDKEEWNAFVEISRQGTFLFNRNYMDYHQDRFHDHSLMIYEKNKLYAILPANEVIGNMKTLYSHQGLTYGGLLTHPKATAEWVIEAFQALRKYLLECHFQRCIYKAIPWIYHSIPSEEDLYALSHTDGKVSFIAREISSSIRLDAPLRFSEQRRRGIKKAIQHNLSIQCVLLNKQQEDIKTFWDILNENLQSKHHTHPVHSKEELLLLMSRFPENIRGYVVKEGDEIVGGSVVFITPQVIHTQYIAASKRGKEIGALDFLFAHLIRQEKWDAQYFDFGKSTEDAGNYLNTNLIHQKEGFGGRGVVYDTYEWLFE